MNKLQYNKIKRLSKLKATLEKMGNEILPSEKENMINAMIVEEGISRKLAVEELNAVLNYVKKID